MSRPVYSDGGDLADAYELSKHARMLYAFSHVLLSVEFCGLASIAVLSGSWPPLGVSHIFDTILGVSLITAGYRRIPQDTAGSLDNGVFDGIYYIIT